MPSLSDLMKPGELRELLRGIGGSATTDTEAIEAEAREAEATAGTVSQQRAQARGLEADIERLKEKAEAEIARERERARADELTREPGEGGVTAETAERLEGLRHRREELGHTLEEYDRLHEKAQEKKRETAFRAAQALRGAFEAALQREVEALEDLADGRGPLPERYRAVVAAREERADLSRRLRHWIGQADASSTQRARLRQRLARFGQGLTGAALTGWALAETLGWLRRFDGGPVAEYLADGGVEPVEGSPRHARPFGALEQVVQELEAGKLPGGTKQV